jgi:hypothetical protein
LIEIIMGKKDFWYARKTEKEKTVIDVATNNYI